MIEIIGSLVDVKGFVGKVIWNDCASPEDVWGVPTSITPKKTEKTKIQ